VTVRQLKAADLPFAFRLNLAERWNDQFSDVERMFRFEPDGCFIAEVDARPVGHVFSISYCSLGWIGLLIVEPEHRRRGIGMLLTVRAKDYLVSRGVQTIKLESVAEIADYIAKSASSTSMTRYDSNEQLNACLQGAERESARP
jgi:GNAT superfamily N-acetyltransferase